MRPTFTPVNHTPPPSPINPFARLTITFDAYDCSFTMTLGPTILSSFGMIFDQLGLSELTPDPKESMAKVLSAFEKVQERFKEAMAKVDKPNGVHPVK